MFDNRLIDLNFNKVVVKMVEIFQCGFYFVLAVAGLIATIFYFKWLCKPSPNEINIEKQTDLLSKIDVTLIGIDCRLRNIEEKE